MAKTKSEEESQSVPDTSWERSQNLTPVMSTSPCQPATHATKVETPQGLATALGQIVMTPQTGWPKCLKYGETIESLPAIYFQFFHIPKCSLMSCRSWHDEFMGATSVCRPKKIRFERILCIWLCEAILLLKWSRLLLSSCKCLPVRRNRNLPYNKTRPPPGFRILL